MLQLDPRGTRRRNSLIIIFSLFRQPLVDDEFVTRCLLTPSSLISRSVRCCSDIKSQICNIIFDVNYPSLWLYSYIRVSSIWQCIAHDGSRLSSILVTWPNRVTRFILSTGVSFRCKISHITLFLTGDC